MTHERITCQCVPHTKLGFGKALRLRSPAHRPPVDKPKWMQNKPTNKKEKMNAKYGTFRVGLRIFELLNWMGFLP